MHLTGTPLNNAEAAVLVHSHPGGEIESGQEDVALTSGLTPLLYPEDLIHQAQIVIRPEFLLAFRLITAYSPAMESMDVLFPDFTD